MKEVVKWTCIACGKKRSSRNLKLISYELEGFSHSRETKMRLRYCAKDPACEKIAFGIADKKELPAYQTPNLKPKFIPRRKYDPICSVGGCGKEHYGKGYCKKHLSQMKRHGKIFIQDDYSKDVPHVYVSKYGPECLVDRCGQENRSRGYCEKHYSQILRHGGVYVQGDYGKKVPSRHKKRIVLKKIKL